MPPTDPAPRTPPPAPRKPRRGDRLELCLEGYDGRGRAVGTVLDAAGRAYRAQVRGAVPGDRARVEVRRRRGERVEAALVELLEPSPRRVAPRCAHFASCGGCSFQDLAYEAQLDELRAGVAALLGSRDLLVDVEVEPVVGDPTGWHYRNKMEFTFGARRWIEPHEPEGAAADFALGLHAPGRFDKVLDVRRCEIVFEEANGILASARELARAQRLAPWDVRAHTGLLRHLVVRKGMNTGEILVSLVTAREEAAAVDAYGAALLARHPEVTTLIQSVNTRPAAVAVGEWERVLHGPGFLRERLLGLEFRVSASSFFQTNTRQAERLFEMLREEAALTGGELVYDLYCGTGSIGLTLAGRAARVVGLEQVPAAVADARRNAEANGIENVEFLEGDVLALVDGLAARPDVCAVDPPRAGLHPRVLPSLLRLAPPRIVWVSCNLRGALDDLGALVAGGYALRRVRPIDLFPHTPHLECALTLERSDTS